ncbi:MAG: PhoH family protein [Mariprofundaceae bacterium]|nr:PhoH family protein [Mariprofundaceae bacterium]
MMAQVQLSLSVEELQRFCGPQNKYLLRIEEFFEVKLSGKSGEWQIDGQQSKQAKIMMTALARTVKLKMVDDLELECLLKDYDLKAQEQATVLIAGRKHIQGKTPKQREYVETILKHDLSLAVGPAGSGKTWLAVACAVVALQKQQVEKIILTRPAVEAGEKLGFLPGDLQQKVDPYLRPLLDALSDMLGSEKMAAFMESGRIEVAPLAYMRGRTLNRSFIILDEAQNTTPAQMKMFLTRLGFDSKMVVTGDVSQMDLPNHQQSGLLHVLPILDNVKGVGVTRLTSLDVVRHPLVERIVNAYDAAESAQ